MHSHSRPHQNQASTRTPKTHIHQTAVTHPTIPPDEQATRPTRYPNQVTNHDLPRDREHLTTTLRALFPHIPSTDIALSPTLGGRVAAEAALAQVQPQAYERSRNFLTGQVTRLSAYLRHGVLTLAEVRDAALNSVREPAHAAKLINEFAWRDYWQRLYYQLGEAIWQDREPWKTGFHPADYAEALPPDIREGATTLACMDSFTHQLVQTGYLHNHARMWFAAYLVHWRRIAWQTGARFFLQHLVDGDPASNNLSWQWVASTFSSKPYIFNRENLERYTAGTYCRTCPHAAARTCPFDSDYEALTQTLFPQLNTTVPDNTLPTPPPPYPQNTPRHSPAPASAKPLLWIHTDSLNPKSLMLEGHAETPAVFLWDLPWLTESTISLKRIVFLAECLREIPFTIDMRIGDPATELLAAARNSGAGHILAQRTPDPRLLAAALAVSQHLPVLWYDPPPFVQSSRTFELKRFSRYWQRAQPSAMQPTRT